MYLKIGKSGRIYPDQHNSYRPIKVFGEPTTSEAIRANRLKPFWLLDLDDLENLGLVLEVVMGASPSGYYC